MIFNKNIYRISNSGKYNILIKTGELKILK